MSFKLASAYTELTARTVEHDRAVDKSMNHVKVFGAETQKAQQLSSKMFLAIGAGAAGAEAIIMKVANAVRDLGGRLLTAAQSGKAFGDEIARWLTDLTGVENAVTALDRRMKEQNADPQRGLIDRLEGLGGSRPIAGLDPEREKVLQAERDALEAQLPAMIEAVANAEAMFRETRGVAAAGGDARARGFMAGPLQDAENAFDEATVELQKLQGNLERVNKKIGEEVFVRESAEKAAKHNEEKLIALGNAVFMVTEKLGNLARGGLLTFDDALRGAVGMAGRGAKGEAERLAEMDKEIEAALDMAAPPNRARSPANAQRAALIGLEEFSSNILAATASQNPELKVAEESKKSLQQIEQHLRSIEQLQKRGPAQAVFAEGAIA